MSVMSGSLELQQRPHRQTRQRADVIFKYKIYNLCVICRLLLPLLFLLVANKCYLI